MDRPISIDSASFDRALTLREAYRVMERFLERHHGRGPTSTTELLAYAGLSRGGVSGDPAALSDFLAAADYVLGRPANS
jgi:hypothetical protein